MYRTSVLLIFALSCIFVGCKKDPAPSTNIPNLSFHLTQVPDSLGSRLRINANGGSYAYANVRINHLLSVNQNRILLKFTGVTCYGGKCAENRSSGGSAANGTVDFERLASGTYQLTVEMNDDQYSGTLEVIASRFSINLKAEPAISFYLKESVLHRIPQDAVWGSVYSSYGDTTSLTSILDSLKAVGVMPSQLPVGDYGIFRIVAPGEISYFTGGLPFVGSYTGSFSTLVQITQHYYNTYRLSCTIENGKGNRN